MNYLTKNIVFVYPNGHRTIVAQIDNKDYTSIIKKLNTSGCKYTQSYIGEDNIYYIYLEESPNDDVMNILDYAFSIKNNIDEDDRWDDDGDDNRDDEEDNDHGDYNEDLDDRDCLEAGTGQWAHN